MSGMALDNIWFGFDAKAPVLKGVSFHVASGEIVGLLGPNGSGKTTTFKVVAGLLRPDEGSVTIGGLSTLGDARAVRRITAFLPDRSLLYERLSAEENLNMFGLLWELPPEIIRRRAEALLTQARLWDVRRRLVNEYSAGMRQKLSFCAALMHDPSIMVIDEPFTALDLDSAEWGRRVLADRARAGAAILFSSHDTALVHALAHRTIALESGRVSRT